MRRASNRFERPLVVVAIILLRRLSRLLQRERDIAAELKERSATPSPLHPRWRPPPNPIQELRFSCAASPESSTLPCSDPRI